ncbi:MAG: DUF4093 domain-containing protein [Ruminococcus sp.]|nr:DUF4093 domain-containing protein [Ruminococcus sp.]
MSKLELKEAVIVEGRYDKIKLSEIIASPVIDTGGFRVFKDKEKQALIREIAAKRGILIMTDVDSAGFVIRNFLRGIVPKDQIKHGYIPTVEGKESRKSEPSKEGKLGVEGIDRESLIRAIRQSGATVIGESVKHDSNITKADFYEYGLSGKDDSAIFRKRILNDLGLPEYLTANAMLAALNCLFTKEEFEEYLNR